MITIDQLKDLQQRADKLKQYLQIDEKRIQLEEEELGDENDINMGINTDGLIDIIVNPNN